MNYTLHFLAGALIASTPVPVEYAVGAVLLAAVGTMLEVVSTKTDKYGRYLGTLYLPNLEDSVNVQIIKAGHAVVYSGGPR